MNIFKKYNKATLSKQEVADELGVSLSTINKWLASGDIIPKPMKLGSSKNATIRFSIDSISDFVNNSEEVI